MERQRSVLIVDDDDTLRATLKKIFEKAGFATHAARNAEEAITAFADQPWDLVLADLKLPRRDGLALLDELRRRRPDARVVIMTAYGDGETEQDAMSRGAFAYLDKPVSRSDLLALCDRAFGGT